MTRFRALTLFLAIVPLFVCAIAGAWQTGQAQLDQARAKRASGDLQGAMDAFERVAADFAASDRSAAAKALLEAGEIFESLGQTGKARGFYERVRGDFKDQPAEAGIATERLTKAASRTAETANAGPAPKRVPSRMTIRTPYADDVYSFALSPDGRTLVVQGTSLDGKKQLWRQHVDAAQKAEPIAGTEGAGASAFPFFSPDGKTIGYFAKQKLWQIDLAGGTAKELIDVSSPWGAAWRGNSIVMTIRGLNGNVEVMEQGKIRPLTTATGFFMAPRFMDDRRFIYFRRNGPNVTLEAGSLDGAPLGARGLPAAHAATFSQGYVLYVTPAGALNAVRFDPQQLAVSGLPVLLAERVGKEDRLPGIAALTASAAGPIAYRETATVKKQLMWMDRAGNLLGTVGLADDASPAVPRVSPDGRSVLFYRQVGTALGSVWIADTESGAQRLVQDRASSAIWSPSGDRVVLSEFNSSGAGMLVERPVSAAASAGKVVVTPGAAFTEDIAPNGAILYRAANSVASAGDLHVISPDRASSALVAQTPASERNARFSPDGKWIAYQSDESGRNEIYVQPFPGTYTQRQRLSLAGGVSPQWGRKGRELYFLSADNRLMLATVERTVTLDHPEIQFSTPKPLFNAPLPLGIEYDTALDGDRFLIIAPIEETPPIIVLSDWLP